MKLSDIFLKIFIWMSCLTIIRFFIEYWIFTQHYSLYSTLTGVLFFIAIIYVTYKEVKT
jgi:hypothetical protein